MIYNFLKFSYEYNKLNFIGILRELGLRTISSILRRSVYQQDVEAGDACFVLIR